MTASNVYILINMKYRIRIIKLYDNLSLLLLYVSSCFTLVKEVV